MPTMDQRLSRLEADMQAVQREVGTLREQTAEQQGEIAALHPLAKSTAGRVERIESTVDRIRVRAEDSEDAVIREIRALGTLQAHPPIWESDQGRWAIRWVCGAAVLCCLALAGSVTYDDLRSWWAGPPAALSEPSPSPEP